jgi:uncharacterized membrane protein YraQ (UPF0718 family)
MAAFHLIPEAMENGGLEAVGFAALGGLLPLWSHHHAERLGGRGEVLILLLGLIPHVAIESAALAIGPVEEVMSLGVAVAAHRLPVGLLLFFLVRHRFGNGYAWAVIGGMMAATLGGFLWGDALSHGVSTVGIAWFQALVGGSLLHVAFSHRLLREGEHEKGCGHEPEVLHEGGHNHGHGHDHDHGHSHTISTDTIWAASGALLGVATLVLALGFGHEHEGHDAGFVDTLLNLSLQTAPALLIAYFLAGLIGVVITPARAQWMAGGSRGSQALRGVVFGLPLPICSCGVLPVYESLVKRGVPAVAAMGFLVATPELGLDAILISIPLLGQEMTLARLGTAFLVAMGAALIVGPKVTRAPACEAHPETAVDRPLGERVKAGLHFGLVELFDHTMPWVLAGLLIAAWVEPILGHGLFQQVPTMLQVPLFALIGIPLYVCASGATPIAAIAIHKGISPGAGLAFLLAGPATNVTTFGILSRLHGRRVAVAFGVVVTLGAVLAGLAIDLLALEVLTDLHSHQHHETSPLQCGALIALVGLFVASLFRQGPRGVVEQITRPVQYTAPAPAGENP